jgi:hypothetical protein
MLGVGVEATRQAGPYEILLLLPRNVTYLLIDYDTSPQATSYYALE